ncbi:MAG: phosphotransferase, partial [Acidobacteriota bacterium]
DLPRSPGDVYQAARAYGSFQRHLLDLPAPPLVETIPAFHDTEARLAALRRAVARDAAGRAAGAAAEIAFAERHADLAPALARLERAGAIRARTIHNDTKLNNVLLDDETGEGLCVVDLDTTMPGIALADFGDLARSATSAAAEDEPDPSRAVVVPELFVAAARGFLDALGDLVTAAERESLGLAARVLTYECGVRFLTDHLDGDRYFRVAHPDHNLQRCRTQFALVASLESREGELLRAIEDAERRG